MDDRYACDVDVGDGTRLAIVLAALTVLLCTAEWADPEDLDRGPHDSTERRRHLLWMGVYVVLAPPIGLLAAHLVTRAEAGTPLDGVGDLPVGVRFALAVATGELAAYWMHRAMHTSGWLWRFHAVHHRASDVRWWTAFRFHPVELALAFVVPYTAAALVGGGRGVVQAYAIVVAVVTLLAHADVHVPGRWLSRVVATPGFHRSHHEADRADTNFALVLPALDVLFGSARFDVRLPRRFGLRSPSDDRQPDRERHEVGHAG